MQLPRARVSLLIFKADLSSQAQENNKALKEPEIKIYTIDKKFIKVSNTILPLFKT